MKIVLTNKKGEGCEAWRALVNKYEPTSKASVVGKLAEIWRTPFDGDLFDAITTLERKIMICEAQSRETVSDSVKIGRIIDGMGQNSMREHLSMSATKCVSWRNFAREIESIEHARKTITAPTLVELMHIKETVTSEGGAGALRKNVGVRAMERQRSINVHIVERNFMDSVGYGIPQIFTERMERRQKKRQGNPARWTGQRRKRRKPCERKRERRDNVSTKSQNHQRNSGQVDIGYNGQNNVGTK